MIKRYVIFLFFTAYKEPIETIYTIFNKNSNLNYFILFYNTIFTT